MSYQLNPLLENNPYLKSGKVIGFGLSGLSTLAGLSTIKENNPKSFLRIKDKVNQTRTASELFSLCDSVGIDTQDLRYYHNKYHYSLDELKERINEKLDKMYKSALINKRIGLGLTSAGAIGLAATSPSVVKATKWAFSH